MKDPVICLWSHGRRPVRAQPMPGRQDRWGGLPVDWCSGCGSEVYRAGMRYCGRCRSGGTERRMYEMCESL